MATTTPPILELPPEVVVHISNFLNTKELGDFRQSCKAIETATFKAFSKDFFSKRQFMLEQVSLQALVDISKHPVLSKQLSEVIISTHKLPNQYSGFNRLSSALIESGYVDQDVLITTGLARDMLVQAFSNLTNLRTVGLRDFDGLGRYRDGIDARWRTYGWSYGRVPHDVGPYQLENRSPDSYLPLILLALGQARVSVQAIPRAVQHSESRSQNQADPLQGTRSIVQLDIILRRHHKLLPRSFDVLGGYMGTTVKPILAGLKQLLLVVDSNERYRLVDPTNDPPPRDALANFLHHCRQLEILRLNFCPNDHYAERFLQWFGALGTTVLGATALGAEFATVIPLSLPYLKTLDLGMLAASPSALVRTICKFDLTSLNLWKITIECAPTDPASFEEFLTNLADVLPTSTAIRNISFGFIHQLRHTPLHLSMADSIRFAKDGDVKNRAGHNVEERAVFQIDHGLSVAQWLRATADRVWLENAEENYISMGDDGSDEEVGDSDLDEPEDEEGVAIDGAGGDNGNEDEDDGGHEA
ncbi:hypothetical protein LTR78_004455 [Recurvomyces mirabilis]|uniref:F-box domain-containing protein n=1 Tax=Recurvomyces mirabilis TaxID=574656 RepID=A0AAE0WQ65_9PEZI|nr:hypothetical protein LTR78_004455 [Recurvomyces mirabilis]KAK5155879.1 hypothetical protein LTS14_005445 [Recurvomyces mirabilis]